MHAKQNGAHCSYILHVFLKNAVIFGGADTSVQIYGCFICTFFALALPSWKRGSIKPLVSF